MEASHTGPQRALVTGFGFIGAHLSELLVTNVEATKVVIAQLFRTIGPRQSGRMLPYDEVYGLRAEDVRHREASIDKIAAAIGWRPTSLLEAILRDLGDHVRTAPVLIADPEQIVAA